jgi:hypothetical protein
LSKKKKYHPVVVVREGESFARVNFGRFRGIANHKKKKKRRRRIIIRRRKVTGFLIFIVALDL